VLSTSLADAANHAISLMVPGAVRIARHAPAELAEDDGRPAHAGGAADRRAGPQSGPVSTSTRTGCSNTDPNRATTSSKVRRTAGARTSSSE